MQTKRPWQRNSDSAFIIMIPLPLGRKTELMCASSPFVVSCPTQPAVQASQQEVWVAQEQEEQRDAEQLEKRMNKPIMDSQAVHSMKKASLRSGKLHGHVDKAKK